MPIYEIENTETGEIFEVMMKIDDKDSGGPTPTVRKTTNKARPGVSFGRFSYRQQASVVLVISPHDPPAVFAYDTRS